MKERLPKDQAMILFKTMLLRHSIQRPPHSLFVFNLNEVKAMTDYVQSSFLKFYLMYQYALITKLELELSHETLSVDHFGITKVKGSPPPQISELAEGTQVNPTEIPDLAEYLNKDDLKRLKGPRDNEGEQEEQKQEG